jgi:methyl-accepting chemotaxis protein
LDVFRPNPMSLRPGPSVESRLNQTQLHQIEQELNSITLCVKSSAAKISEILGESEKLAVSAGDAQETANAISNAMTEFTTSARGIHTEVGGVRSIVNRANEAAITAADNLIRLKESSSTIGEIVNLIKKIAKQTSLLALNSKIEAARAGEAGRGFDVVASEIKSLAVQTEAAAESIRKRIGALQNDANSAIEAVQGIVAKMTEVSPVVGRVEDSARKQDRITAEVEENIRTSSRFIFSVIERANEIGNRSIEANHIGDIVIKAGENLMRFANGLRE